MKPTPVSTLPYPSAEPMVWHGWGDPAQRHGLPEGAERFLADRIGALGPQTPPVAFDAVRMPPSRLDADVRARLVAAVGADGVADDRRARLLHAGGKSYPDLIRLRTGDAEHAPDAVVLPRTHAEVRTVLDVCGDAAIAIVPFGGGTSVVGGVEPLRDGHAAVIALDLARMDRLVELDEVSHSATFEPGIRGPQAEALLRARGFTLGHFPQSYEYATLGGYVASRSAGQASTGYGRIDELVVGLRCASPAGDLVLGRAPASAAGPDLRGLLVGSEGLLGILTEVTLRVHPAPDVEVHEAWAAPNWQAGFEAFRAMRQAGVAADICRLSDEDETAVFLAQAGRKAAPLRALLRARRARCLVILGWEGASEEVALRRSDTGAALRDAGLLRLGGAPARAWARTRFAGPYLRDELLDRGVLVETLETAASWTKLGATYAGVRGALLEALAQRGALPLVLCHISHLYEGGASLYFTWLARAEPGGELAQWRAAKTAASEAIVAAGATISHHHGVGTDHAVYLTAEIGDLGVAVLRAAKAVLDPRGILNPGKLLP